jgi:hypothetical protein
MLVYIYSVYPGEFIRLDPRSLSREDMIARLTDRLRPMSSYMRRSRTSLYPHVAEVKTLTSLFERGSPDRVNRIRCGSFESLRGLWDDESRRDVVTSCIKLNGL